MKNVIIVLAVSGLSILPAWATNNPGRILHARPIPDDGIERPVPAARGQYVPGLDKAMFLNWVAVDSMSNALGPANIDVKPMVYDPATNVLAVIHRGASPYAAGSGQLWYNISRDAGVTWRRVGELNGGAPLDCRYPSAAISNPAGNTDTAQCLFVYSAPNLENGGAFGQITYGVDFPLGGGAGSGVVDPGNNMYIGATTIWTQPATPSIFWTTFDGRDHTLWRTTDYLTITREIPPSWHGVPPYFLIPLGLVGGKGTHAASYYATLGLFYPDSTARAFNAGYSKSTDNGVTWSGWYRPSPDWMQATGLPTNLKLFDYYQADGPDSTVSYTSDMVVDANSHVHFFHVIADSPWTSHVPRHIVEIYETGTGWAYKWVQQNLNPYTGLGYPGSPPTPYLDQTHNSIHASITPDGQMMTMAWLDAATTAQADTFPDVWFSYRSINWSQWSTPQNLTQTPGFPELLLHAAPVVKVNGGGSYTVFLGRSYQSNINTYPPDNGVKTTFFVSPYTFFIEDVKETGQQPAAFHLDQNYPNPFNPSTTISYELSIAGFVRLKVLDILGREVATLVNEEQKAGRKSVQWNASNVASGVYYYRLDAGSFTSVKKLLLLR